MSSSSDYAMQVSGLGKQYRLGEQSGSTLLRDTVARWIRRPWQAARADAGTKVLWALQDASFTVRRGEAVGIIGHNGAGKSTLLKLISRITEPSTGRIGIRGRIASLLEVGTGFHPDLTGRENIFMNGAILGMSRAEIRRKFDEIVDFAGVERFINTPVRRYSSGMTVRLAFAVAAHLEPEILLLDEVLAVGDAEFQRKCMGKMNEVAHHDGRTILFVSHNLASIQQLCQRVIVLHHGRIACDTDTAAGIATYLAMAGTAAGQIAGRQLGEELELGSFELSPGAVEVFGDVNFEMTLRARENCTIHELCLLLQNNLGQRVALADFRPQGGTFALSAGQTLRISGTLRRMAFIPGSYTAGFFVRADRLMKDYLGLQTLEVLPRTTGEHLLSYGSEFLGSVALDSIIATEITN
jgi:lipopolysaccharide transport system ATP-binding protein